MADDNGQMPTSEVQASEMQTQTTATQEPQTYSADYVKTLREEAKESRLQLKTVNSELEQLKVAAGNNQELQGKIDKMAADLAKARAEATSATQRADLARLAAKASVPIEIAELLDLSKIDLTDEAKALEQLSKFTKVNSQQSHQIKPGTWGNTGLTEAELRTEMFGGKSKTSIFGG